MKILLTGGGTGGHIYPALALAERFLAAGDRVEYLGFADGLEARLVPKTNIPFVAIDAAPLPRRLSGALFSAVLRNIRGAAAAFAAVRDFAPDAVIATGGYVSFPAMLASFVWGKTRGAARPFLGLLEPNAVPGLTNRLLAPIVDELWGSWPAAAGTHTRRFVATGVPVRSAYTTPPEREAASASFGFDAAKFTLLVIGGSQGARSLNTAMAQLFARDLPDGWQFLHIAGEAAREQAEAAGAAAVAAGRARVFGYLDDPLTAYAAADLVVARAGASTLAELAQVGKPAVLVPYPHATADHQTANARAFIGGGGGRLVPDAQWSGERLHELLEELKVPGALHALRTAAQKSARADAGATIVARVHEQYHVRGANGS